MKTRERSTVGIRDLKNHTSAIMRLTRRGETITVTDRNRPVAVIVPLIERSTADLIRELAKTGQRSAASAQINLFE